MKKLSTFRKFILAAITSCSLMAINSTADAGVIDVVKDGVSATTQGISRQVEIAKETLSDGSGIFTGFFKMMRGAMTASGSTTKEGLGEIARGMLSPLQFARKSAANTLLSYAEFSDKHASVDWALKGAAIYGAYTVMGPAGAIPLAITALSGKNCAETLAYGIPTIAASHFVTTGMSLANITSKLISVPTWIAAQMASGKLQRAATGFIDPSSIGFGKTKVTHSAEDVEKYTKFFTTQYGSSGAS